MWTQVLTVGLLVSQATAGVVGSAGALLGRRSHSMEEVMKRYVDSIVEPIEKRQSTVPATPKLNVTEWDAATTAACTTALEALNGQASNPSGMAVCYNLPFLDNSTGVFQADLRLYMIGAPTGDFANIPAANVNVGLSYTGATVSAVNASSLSKRMDVSLISWPRAEMGKRQAAVPTISQSYSFVGKINPDLLAAKKGTADLQKILVPAVTLTAMNATGQTVNTTLSSSEATFVNGVFANQVIAPTKSRVVPPIQTLVVTGDTLFVVPGMNILLFPIGGIITGTWAVLFLSTIAYGTAGRISFREQYRRRNALATRGDLARI